jgi:uncharacterized protein involved in outer membrane biogenesis
MRRRALVVILAVLVLLAALVAAGLNWYLPAIIHRTAIWRLQAATGRTVTIEALDISLATGEFSIRGFRIADRETGPPLAEFERLEGRFHRRSLLRGHVWIERLTLTGGHARIVRLGPNRYNISDLLERPSSSGGLDVSIDHFTITGGWVELEDRVLKPARTWRSADIRLDARDLTTRERKGTAIGFTTFAGALVNLRIEELQLAPVRLRAFLNVRDLDLALAAVYLPGDAPLKIEQGVLDAAYTIVHDAKDGTTIDADGVVQKVVLRRPEVPGDAVTSPVMRFMVREFHQRPDAIVLRYASLGGDLTVLDPTTTTPRKLVFSDFTATASGLETQKGRAQLAIHAKVPGGGEVDIGGTASLAPRRADLRVKARSIELATIGRYLPLQARLDGVATADVKVAATQTGTQIGLTVAGDATLERVTVADDSRTLVSAARAGVTGIDYTWPATVRIAELAVSWPSAIVERNASGEINLTTLLQPRVSPPDATDPASSAPTPGSSAPAAPPAASAPASSPLAVDIQVAHLRIDDGRATLTDAASGGHAEVTRIALTAGNLAWPLRGSMPVELSAGVAGGEVTVRGTVDGAQRRMEAALRVRGADLATLQPWLPIVGQLRGAADADVTTTVAFEPFALTLRGTLGAAKLAFLDRDRPLITVDRVDVSGVDAQWPTKLAIDRLRVTEPWARIERDPQGTLSLRALFARRPDRPAPPGEASLAPGPIPGLQVSVREASFDNGGSSIVDTSVEPAARFEMRGTNLTLRNLTWPATSPAAVDLNTPMPSGGTLKARGTLSIQPTQLALEAELDQVDLGPARPYVPIEARVRGKVSGRVKINGTFGETITLVVDGDATAERLTLGDDQRRLATIQRAEMTGFRYQYPTSIRIRQIALRKPWLLFERNSDGSFELASLFVSRTAPTTPPPAGGNRSPASASAPVRVLIGTLTMEDGFVRFVDRTTNPDFAEELSAVTLTAEGLGTRAARRAKVALRATFASGTPLSVRGEVAGFTGPYFLNLTVDITDYPVPRLNPYLDHLLGWVAKNGTLTATMQYQLAGDDLQAENDVTLRGLDLERAGAGGAVQQRVGLPLDTLVGVLKDRKGDIHVNVPVRGSLSAPEFHYGEALWAAIRNMAIRLVALPFSLIGKLFFTEDSRIASVAIDPVTFQTGKVQPTPPGAEQLGKLATFLRDSSGVRLRLRPVTTVADVTSLRRDALEARLTQAGADAAARRQAAVGLYTELFPLRQPPTSDEALMDALTRETPPPPRALRALATDRLAAARDSLVRAGVAAERLEPLESRAAVESEGSGRVEFEIAR